MRCIRPLFLTAVLLAVSATLIFAAETLSIWVGPGTTEIDFAGVTVVVESSDDVIVYLSAVDGQVTGRVSTAPGTRSATVTIILADDPERVIFTGRVVAPVWFADYLPQETGRGEQ